MSAELREATRADLDALLGLIANLYSHECIRFRPSDVTRALVGLIDTPALGGVWLITEGEADALGYLVLTFSYSLELGGRYALIDELYVKPEHRGQGLGSMALRQAEAACRALGVRALRLEADRANSGALRLYSRLGFRAESRDLLTLRLTDQ